MDKKLLEAGLKHFLIPEVMKFIRRHHGDTGQLPTDEEVIAQLPIDADRVIASGEEFLRSKGADVVDE